MIRFLEPQDIPRVKELQNEYEWEYGPDFMGALAVVENDKPVMVVGAWMRAEVHMVTDSTWNTPAGRLAALAELHDRMEKVLKDFSVGEAITWMDDMKAFGRRLEGFGWAVAKHVMWARRIM